MVDHFADGGKMVRFRGVTKMYAAGKHFVEVNKMLTAEALRPVGAAWSKGLGCCPTSFCTSGYRRAQLATDVLSVIAIFFNLKQLGFYAKENVLKRICFRKELLYFF